MKSIFSTITILFSLILLVACGGEKKGQKDSETEVVAQEIFLSPATSSPKFPGADLKYEQPAPNAMIPAGEVTFKYAIENYELTAQTEDAEIKECANSPEGQHIHLILNNEPYLAKYESEFGVDLEEGHYIALSFLSRSYHESLKNKEAFDIIQFNVGEVVAEPADLTAPHLFYSRPKGEYVGEDTRKILLDFFLLNTPLSETGNQVKATINGTEFVLTEWKPYFVEGLPMGENTFKLELIDARGNGIPGPFNSAERTITLKP